MPLTVPTGLHTGSPTGSTTSSSNWSSVLSLSGMSGSTGSGLVGGSGGIALDDMQAAALRRHLEALQEKLDDVCDEIVLVKVLSPPGSNACCVCVLRPVQNQGLIFNQMQQHLIECLHDYDVCPCRICNASRSAKHQRHVKGYIFEPLCAV